jgi:uncharacterized membrane protein
VDDFDLYRLFKTLHVMSVILLGSGIMIQNVAGPLLPRMQSVQAVRALAQVMNIGEKFLIFPAFVLLAIFGYLTADRVNYSLDLTWLLIGQILFYIAVVISVLYLRAATDHLVHAANAAPDGPVPAEITAEMKKPGPAIVGSALTLVYFFIVYLMVAKPDW